MKEQLIELAERLHFVSNSKAVIIKTHTDLDYYLWMCELQKWLREKHKIDISIIKNSNNLYSCYVLYFDSLRPLISHDKALEKGLIKALKLIK